MEIMHRKQWPCAECGRRFSKKGDRDRHRRTHLNREERPVYPCPHCKKRFLRKDNQQKHSRLCLFHAPAPLYATPNNQGVPLEIALCNVHHTGIPTDHPDDSLENRQCENVQLSTMTNTLTSSVGCRDCHGQNEEEQNRGETPPAKRRLTSPKQSTSFAEQINDKKFVYFDEIPLNETNRAEYCPHCNRGPFRHHFNLNQHIRDVHLLPRLHPANQVGGGSDVEQRIGRFTLEETAANRGAENYALDVQADIEDADPDKFILDSNDLLLDFLSKYFQQWDKQAIKMQLVLSIRCHRLTLEGRQTMTMHIRTDPIGIMGVHDNLEERVNEIAQDLTRRLDEAENRGSGWIYDSVEKFLVEVTRFDPIRGSKFVQLPDTLKSMQSLINPHNDDDQCFLFCIAMFDDPPKDGAFGNVKVFNKYFAEYDVQGVTFPVSPAQVPHFEKRNGRAITILGYEWAKEEQDRVYIIYASTMPESMPRMFLLLLEEGHYVLIKNLRGFMNHFRKKWWETITETQYQQAMLVWKTFSCKTIGDDAQLYCRVDTILLSTVFERFRKQTMQDFDLEASSGRGQDYGFPEIRRCGNIGGQQDAIWSSQHWTKIPFRHSLNLTSL
ncbi:unnamed protein product [Darwinula stevensoni]|uniref:C2H2-type domain-containing protein n=1 Tax=Darwinula stevensoni TaxID=69355 RepID=A0A7R9AB12_9CRUS|nr:unnamed protein product [Darwinula stevensoni]CAG0898614.1 unnamed protein product [Darwinula stevensoni]